MLIKFFALSLWGCVAFGNNHLALRLKKDLDSFYSFSVLKKYSFHKSIFHFKEQSDASDRFIENLNIISPCGNISGKNIGAAILMHFYPLDVSEVQSSLRYRVNKLGTSIVNDLDAIKNELIKLEKRQVLDDLDLFYLKKLSEKLLLNLEEFSKKFDKFTQEDKSDYVEQILIRYKSLYDSSRRTYFSGFSSYENYLHQQSVLISVEKEVFLHGSFEQKSHLALIPLQRVLRSNQGEASFYQKVHSKFAEERKVTGLMVQANELDHAKDYIRRVVKEASKSEVFSLLLYIKEMLFSIKPLRSEAQLLIDNFLSNEILMALSLQGESYESSVPVLFCVNRLESWGAVAIRSRVTEAYNKPHKMENIICILLEEILLLGAKFQDAMIETTSNNEALEYEKDVIKERLQNFEINFELLVPEVDRFIHARASLNYSARQAEEFFLNYVVDMITSKKMLAQVGETIFKDSQEYITELSTEASLWIERKKFLIIVDSLLKKKGSTLTSYSADDLSKWLQENYKSMDFLKHKSKIITKLKSYSSDLDYILFIYNYLEGNLEKETPITKGMQNKIKSALRFYLRKGYVNESFWGEKDVFFKEGIERFFDKILKICTYYYDSYSLALEPLVKERVLSSFFAKLRSNEIYIDDGQIVNNKAKLYRYAMLAQTIVYVRQMISFGSLFLRESHITDEVVEKFIQENIGEVEDFDRSDFLGELQRIAKDFYLYLVHEVKQDRDSSADFKEIEYMVSAVSKSPGTKRYYKYLLSVFKENFISGSKSFLRNIILDNFAKEINSIYSELAKGIKSYLGSDFKDEGICRRFDFMRSGLVSTSN
jgi:hypothetical protein